MLGTSPSAGTYQPVGILDGTGAYLLDARTVRVFVNHELSSGGYLYNVDNGAGGTVALDGARISYFDIDKATRKIVDAGQAINKLYDRSGAVVTSTAQLEFGRLSRLCSANLFQGGMFASGSGVVSTIFLSNEENSSNPGGSYWALDASNGDLWALPDLGRGSWEAATQIDTGRGDNVAFLLGDDQSSAPLYLYVGKKNAAGNFLEQNGLSGGQLYAWRDQSGDVDTSTFNGTGSSRVGEWVPMTNTGVGATFPGGYATDDELNNQSDAAGGFSFSRPEDLATDPFNGTRAVMASTGSSVAGGSDLWGTTYIFDTDFAFDQNGDLDTAATVTTATIIYDGDDAGAGQFAGPDFGLRSPDNLAWAEDGLIYIQEDRSVGGFGAASGEEASIWVIDPITGQLTRTWQIDRSAVAPLGTTDPSPADIGNWESSGILDVSTLFGEAPGTLFIADIEAHSLRDGVISSDNLSQGGQLVLLQVPEPTSLALFGLAGLGLLRRRR